MTISTTSALQPRQLVDPAVCLGTWFGVGLLPAAPGTLGSLAALPLIWLTKSISFFVLGSLVAGLFVLGVWSSNRIEQRYGLHDPGAIVIDEVVGQWLAVAIPLAVVPGWLPDWQIFVLGFVLFRFFDIAKPPPVGWLDRRVPGGMGVMLDDVAAGLLAALTIAALPWLSQLH